MTRNARIMCGVTLITVPSIQYGSYFLLTILSGTSGLSLTGFQKSMFRAGHAHAGVLVNLSLIAQLFVDNAKLSNGWAWAMRIGFPLAAILVSGGFFASAIGRSVTSPNQYISILYTGVVLLAFCLLVLGVALIRTK